MGGYFSHKYFRIFNLKCVFYSKHFTNKTDKNKILELNMNIEFGRVGLSTMITSWENYRIICVIPFSKKEGKEITP